MRSFVILAGQARNPTAINQPVGENGQCLAPNGATFIAAQLQRRCRLNKSNYSHPRAMRRAILLVSNRPPRFSMVLRRRRRLIKSNYSPPPRATRRAILLVSNRTTRFSMVLQRRRSLFKPNSYHPSKVRRAIRLVRKSPTRYPMMFPRRCRRVKSISYNTSKVRCAISLVWKRPTGSVVMLSRRFSRQTLERCRRWTAHAPRRLFNFLGLQQGDRKLRQMPDQQSQHAQSAYYIEQSTMAGSESRPATGVRRLPPT